MSGMSKNDLKSFMKQTLDKTKEAGSTGMVVVGGNGYKRVNHFQPKKKEPKKEVRRSNSRTSK